MPISSIVSRIIDSASADAAFAASIRERVQTPVVKTPTPTAETSTTSNRLDSDIISLSPAAKRYISQLQAQNITHQSTLTTLSDNQRNARQVIDFISRSESALGTSSNALSSAQNAYLQSTLDMATTGLSNLAASHTIRGYKVVAKGYEDVVFSPEHALGQQASGRASARINFTANFTANQTLRLNGSVFKAITGNNSGLNFKMGATLEASLDSLVARANAQTATNIT